MVQVEYVQSVPDQVLLDLIVERRVCHEARRLVDFNEPALTLAVEEDVHAEYLEAHGVLDVLRLRAAEQMCHRVDARHQCLHANLLDLLPHFIARLV